MRFLSTYLHGFADYGVGLVLILLPYLGGFADGTAAQWAPQALGLAAIVYSLFTRYELGWRRVIPMTAHLWLDGLSGLLLLASPWIFGFSTRVCWPHVVFGIIEIAASLLTRTRSPLEQGPRSALS